jgi:hypothetical protein
MGNRGVITVQKNRRDRRHHGQENGRPASRGPADVKCYENA